MAAKVTSSEPQSEVNDNKIHVDDNTCVVCFKNVEVFSIGECDHPVCFECSTRMRVLCQQNECPICRQVLSKVIFTYDKLPYRELEAKNRSEYFSKKYKIGFYTSDIQQKFFELLDHPCPKCNVPPYRTFQGLKNHVRKEHDLYYCDICLEHLKIFTFERRCYTQAELGLHRTKGDTDNRSHRGHPLCEYCNKRYLDRDELFRHLRREHYFCHFCDADGCNEFYRDYSALAEHFRQDHYLCEEGKCATEQFTGAFRSEIDYKAHVATAHGKTLNKQQAKQTRTLQLEITLGPRGRSGQAEQGIANMRSRGNDEMPNEILEASNTQSSQNNQRSITIDACSEQEFPSLGGAASGPSISLTRPPPPSMRNRSAISGLARTKENFPALGSSSSGGGSGGSSSTSATRNQQIEPISSVLRKTPTTSTGAIPRTNTPTNANANAAAAAAAAAAASGSMVIHVSNRPTHNGSTMSKSTKPSAVDFPALPSGKSKKHAARAVADEDMLPSSNVQLPMATVSAKHRTMVDDYVSVANPSNFQKIQLVQKEELESKTRKAAEAMAAPKLTSQDFPSLGGGENSGRATVPSTWLKAAANDKKQRELDNRKSKIAPAPLLSKHNNNNQAGGTEATISTNNNNTGGNPKNSTIDNTTKKDKKAKDKKMKERNNNENKSSTNDHSNDNAAAQQTLRPPPGFDNQNATVKPPPGFHSNVTLNSVAKSPNNLTFTSSLGESYSIVPSHNYIQPLEAMKRNQKLVSYFKETLKTPEALEEFRHISQKFREGVYKTNAYYEHCQAALKDKFDKIFPELLVLLPDISKQQALYLVHTQRLNAMSPAQRKTLPKLEVCSTCKQVLLQNDLDSHRKSHELSQHFPKLNGNNKTSSAACGNTK